MEQEQQGTSAPASRAKRYAFPLAVLAVCVILAAYVLWNQYGGSKYPKGADFAYTDLDGQTVTLKNTNGSVRLLYFFYSYCPDVCPPTTFLMSQVQDELKKEGKFGSEVKFLSVTIDPTRDTPERLKEWSAQFGADPGGWKFLRGDEKATADLAKQYQILVTKDAEGNFGHMNLIVLLDKKGRIRDWISANDYFANGDRNLPLSDFVKQITDLL
ncbi:SCO family protein [Cohnella caldifontis]|uniref:SCO family protein n=1 Tax=Cohnella caldifontis TaxID=3027471 RepID=UPI0023EA9ABE|nr:SCO family protein [Cohnella sp. YIM B05605]